MCAILVIIISSDCIPSEASRSCASEKMNNSMFDENIQAALKKLDKSVPKKRRYATPLIAAMTVFILTAGVGLWSFNSMVPAVSQDNLLRMIIVSSRNSTVDPIRLMLSVEERAGKKIEDFDSVDRAKALEFLMNKIELQKDRTEMVVY